jgi:hypothetical protein
MGLVLIIFVINASLKSVFIQKNIFLHIKKISGLGLEEVLIAGWEVDRAITVLGPDIGQ